MKLLLIHFLSVLPTQTTTVISITVSDEHKTKRFFFLVGDQGDVSTFSSSFFPEELEKLHPKGQASGVQSLEILEILSTVLFKSRLSARAVTFFALLARRHVEFTTLTIRKYIDAF